MANERKYDEIQFFKNGTSLGITCLPDYSDEKLRYAIMIHICQKTIPDRFRILTNGKISLGWDSDNSPTMKKEIESWQPRKLSA